MALDPHRVQLDPDAILRCPCCSGAYLHHGRVEVFERPEDASTGFHVHVDGQRVHIDTDLAGNPSRRRTGIKIAFECELCGTNGTLSFVQHKGNTFVEWC